MAFANWRRVGCVMGRQNQEAPAELRAAHCPTSYRLDQSVKAEGSLYRFRS